MRVNDLAKEMGKTNNELLGVLLNNGINKTAMSNISQEEAALLRKSLSSRSTEKHMESKDTNHGTTKKSEGKGTEKSQGKSEEAPKKKLTAVFRPQNAQQKSSKKSGSSSSGQSRRFMVSKKEENKEEREEMKKQSREEKPAVSVAEPKKDGKESQRLEPRETQPQEKPEPQAAAVEVSEVVKPRNVYAEMAEAAKQKTAAKPIRNIYREQEERAKARAKEGKPAARSTRDPRGPRSEGNRGPGNRSFDNRGRNQGGNRGFSSDRLAGTRDKDRPAGGERGRTQGTGFRKDSVAPVMDPPMGKKTTNRPNKNNFKNNKNDKKHRTEDGPAKGKVSKHPFIMPVKQKAEEVLEDIKEIVIPDSITIKDFASQLKLQPSTIVKKLFLKGQVVTLNTELTFEQAEELALDYDIICIREEKVDVIGELLKEEEEDAATMVPRPPVVVVMGHVDHGKTSLLDAIRKSNVTSREAGGITQHIGAYMVKINGQPITFLDTPGHEAFTAMRMRGAQATDIAVLVVAADDGVMPQTVEAINHAKAAGVEIVVAVNKIDKPAANLDKVKQELSEYELIPEDWGGSTIFVPVSAKTGEGIENLLEMIILTAEVKELRANPNRRARGLVIEAELDKGKGPVARILVQKGTLHVGDFIAAGACSGKVRAMMNDKGIRVKEATPSTPVEILGLDNVPNAGEVFVATENDKEAKAFAATFISESKNKLIEDTKAKLSLDDLFSQIKAGNVKELPIVVKADVQGSVEAVKQSLTKLSNEEVAVKVIHGGVGTINESDVALASASNAIIIGFNVKPEAMAKASAERENVDIRLYRVIYQAIEDVESAMKGMLEPVYEERVIGHAEIRQLFKASGIGTIAGSYILDGKFVRGCKCRITREGNQIFDGPLASLKRFKDDVKEVASGYECGLVFEKFNDIQELDLVEAYDMVEVPRT